MDTVSYSELRQRLKAYMDRVCDDRAPLLVTRQGGDPVVMLSAAEYDALEETLHLLRDPANAEHLRRRLQTPRRGRWWSTTSWNETAVDRGRVGGLPGLRRPRGSAAR